jgi:hypothetical protein
MTKGIVKSINPETMRIVITPTDEDSRLPEKDLDYNNTYTSKLGNTINVTGMMNSVGVGDKVEFSDWDGMLKFIKPVGSGSRTSVNQPNRTSFNKGYSKSTDIDKERRITYLACLHDGVSLAKDQGYNHDEIVDIAVEHADKLFKEVTMRFPTLKVGD